MNESKILNKIKDTLPERMLETVQSIDNELLLKFSSVIESIKELDTDPDGQMHLAMIAGYVTGIAIQKHRDPNPLVNHIKENDLIAVEFKLDDKLGAMYVPKDITNTEIKKRIILAAKENNAKWDGNFRKLSEFENAKRLKDLSEMF